MRPLTGHISCWGCSHEMTEWMFYRYSQKWKWKTAGCFWYCCYKHLTGYLSSKPSQKMCIYLISLCSEHRRLLLPDMYQRLRHRYEGPIKVDESKGLMTWPTHLVYLVFQGARGICGVAGETSDHQGCRAPASSPSAQRGWRSAMTQSVYGQKQTWNVTKRSLFHKNLQTCLHYNLL